MGVILAEIKEAIDTALDGGRQFIGNNVPLVVTFYIEETALIICVGLRLIEVTVLTNVLLHITVAVNPVITLQF